MVLLYSDRRRSRREHSSAVGFPVGPRQQVDAPAAVDRDRSGLDGDSHRAAEILASASTHVITGRPHRGQQRRNFRAEVQRTRPPAAVDEPAYVRV
jgi:hypothetical protein